MPITVRHREKFSLIAVAVVAATLAGCSSPSNVPSSGVKSPSSATKLTPPLDVFNISLVDPFHGWALTVAGATKGIRVLKTKDGGSNWELATPPQLGELEPDGAYELFPGLRLEESWLIVNTRSNGTLLLRTSDGGSTWEILPRADPARPVPSSLPSPGGKSGPVFLDTQHGWIGSGPSTKGQGHLYATDDGGKSWHEQALPLPATTAAADVRVSAPRFFSPTVGVKGSRLLFVTHNQGATWVQLYPPVAHR
jgi:photosystem II stability/assembly factor-like uncharacterized protein